MKAKIDGVSLFYQAVGPETGRYARDVSALAKILGLERYALLGHSYGAFVTLAHAVEDGEASQYVISHGAASGAKMMAEVHENLARFEPVELRDQGDSFLGTRRGSA